MDFYELKADIFRGVVAFDFYWDGGSDSEFTTDRGNLRLFSGICTVDRRPSVSLESDDMIDNDRLKTESSSSELERQTF